MKYIVVLTDGMADEPIPAFSNKTPMEVAKTPNLDALALTAEVGLVKTVPEGMTPGSDVANLSVMGFDPKRFHTGRSPLEAASIGVALKDTDVTFRCNIVTLISERGTLGGENNFEDLIMQDHSSGDITTEEAHELMVAVDEAFGSEVRRFFTGVSYRHLLRWQEGDLGFDLTPPHDILGQRITDFLPRPSSQAGPKSQAMAVFIDSITRRSYELLSMHPVNLRRMEKGLNPANCIWIWGEGKKPALTSFMDAFGLRGHVISAVDLIKGIGILAGLNSIDVVGATGNLHTNFRGKADAALKALLSGDDFSYIHIEAPDECGHQGDANGKVTALERIDAHIVGPLVLGLREAGEDFRLLVVPDHPTPVHLRTHTSAPVPFLLYDSRCALATYDGNRRFTEVSAGESVAKKEGRTIGAGHYLMSYLIGP